MEPTRRFIDDTSGATAVEYAVVLMLILMAMFATISIVGAEAGGLWGGIESDLQETGFIHGGS